jgi:hypothetical protein
MDSKFIGELKTTLERLENDRELHHILWNNYGHIFGGHTNGSHTNGSHTNGSHTNGSHTNKVSIFLLLKSSGIFMTRYLTNYSQVNSSHVHFMAWICDEFENLPIFIENETKSKPVEMFYAISPHQQTALIDEYNRIQSY